MYIFMISQKNCLGRHIQRQCVLIQVHTITLSSISYLRWEPGSHSQAYGWAFNKMLISLLLLLSSLLLQS